jgi:hypothetical protein
MIRPAYAEDARAVARLAALDSAERVPDGPMLLAEVDGELRAALAVNGATAIADPFFPTLEIVALLRAHAAAATQPRRRGRRRPLVPRPSLARG